MFMFPLPNFARKGLTFPKQDMEYCWDSGQISQKSENSKLYDKASYIILKFSILLYIEMSPDSI